MTSFQPSYKLCMRIQRAQALLPAENMDKLNPYIVFQLQGSSEKVKTKALKETTDPIYNVSLELNGFFVGSDLLNIWVYNRGEGNESEDEIVGCATLYVSTLSLGETQNYIIELYKYNKKKNDIDRKSKRGSAGSIFCQFHVAQPEDTPFVNKEWLYPLYNAWLEIIDAKNCPAVSDGSADPLVSTTISPAANTQLYKTKVMHSLDPVWNARTKILLDNYQKQTINITMESKGKTEKKPMGSYQLSLAKCAVGHIYEDNVELSSVDGKPPAVLHYRLQITAKDTEPFKFIRDKDVFEEEESVKSSQSVKSIEKQAVSNVRERSIGIPQDEAKSNEVATQEATKSDEIVTQEAATAEKKKPINLSRSPKRRLLTNSDVNLDKIKIRRGISDSPCVLHINLIEARNLQKESDPFVNFSVRSYQKEASVKSKVIQNTQNPQWNENFDINSPSLISDVLVVDMYNKDPLPENKLMDTIELPICNLPYKDSYIFDRNVKLNNQTTGRLNFIINCDAEDNEHCKFQWGDFGSSYSTSFTGYSHRGHSISAHSSDERNTYHVHEEITKEMRKPKKVENITVFITGFRNIPFESKSAKTYLTIERRTKTKSKAPAQKFDDVIHFSQPLTAKYDNVKPGNLIEVLIYQYPSNDVKHPQLVCGRRFKVKEMDFEGQEKYFKLLDPVQLDDYYDSNVESTSNVGELKMTFKHEVSFK